MVATLADSPCVVIRGRGSQFILKDHPRAFHVLVVAPLGMRAERVMGSLEVGQEVAVKAIERAYRGRREFIRRYFYVELEDPVSMTL